LKAGVLPKHVFIHEFTHFIDRHRYKKDWERSEKNQKKYNSNVRYYHNTPDEFNAHCEQFFSILVKTDLFDGPDNQLKSRLEKMMENPFSEEMSALKFFYNDLKEHNKRRFIDRLYALKKQYDADQGKTTEPDHSFFKQEGRLKLRPLVARESIVTTNYKPFDAVRQPSEWGNLRKPFRKK
jgi:hypothetical protein